MKLWWFAFTPFMIPVERLLKRTMFGCVCSEIRAQLVEQQKCLEQQTDMRVQLLQDLQDFFRKKSEIEMEYSRNLEKLAERFMAKTRSTKDHQQYKWVCCITFDSFLVWISPSQIFNHWSTASLLLSKMLWTFWLLLNCYVCFVPFMNYFQMMHQHIKNWRTFCTF